MLSFLLGFDGGSTVYFTPNTAPHGAYAQINGVLLGRSSLTIFETDFRYHVPDTGLEFRGEFADVIVGNPANLRANNDGDPTNNVGKSLFGASGEVTYHSLWAGSRKQVGSGSVLSLHLSELSDRRLRRRRGHGGGSRSGVRGNRHRPSLDERSDDQRASLDLSGFGNRARHPAPLKWTVRHKNSPRSATIWLAAVSGDLAHDAALTSGHGEIELLSGDRVRFGDRAMRIDLGGIAKGFAVDRAIDVSRDFGMPSGLANAGGDLAVFGPRGLMVTIRDPGHPSRVLCQIALRVAAIASSCARFDPQGARVLLPIRRRADQGGHDRRPFFRVLASQILSLWRRTARSISLRSDRVVLAA
jgi:hypothetical protein